MRYGSYGPLLREDGSGLRGEGVWVVWERLDMIRHPIYGLSEDWLLRVLGDVSRGGFSFRKVSSLVLLTCCVCISGGHDDEQG